MIFSLFWEGAFIRGGVYFKLRDFRGAFIRGNTVIKNWMNPEFENCLMQDT